MTDSPSDRVPAGSSAAAHDRHGHVHGPDCDHGHDHHGHVHGPDCGHDHHAPVKPFVRPAPKVGRNDPCPCGSGMKHKKCCLAA